MKDKKRVLIEKYINRIKIDYPEDDKLMMDLLQFASELTELEQDPTAIEQVREAFDPIQLDKEPIEDYPDVDDENNIDEILQSKEHSEKLGEKNCENCLYQFKPLAECAGCAGCQSNYNKWTPKEQQPNKEAEEILCKKRLLIKDGVEWVTYNSALKAMQEYARQSRREVIEDWMEYLEEEIIDIVYQNDEQEKEYLINQYLKP